MRCRAAAAAAEPVIVVGGTGFSRVSREGNIATMAQSVTVMLVDDIDQSDAAETVHFGVDGAAYEIDLSAKLGTPVSCALCSAATSARPGGSGRPRYGHGGSAGPGRGLRWTGSSRGGSAPGPGTGGCWPHPGPDPPARGGRVRGRDAGLGGPGQVARRSRGSARVPRERHEASERAPRAWWCC